MFVPLFSICLLKLLFFTSITSANEDQGTLTSLPTHIEPLLYTIKLITHLENAAPGLDGYANITIRVNNKTDKIILHSKKLHMSRIELFSQTFEPVPIKDYTIDEKTDFLIIRLKESIWFGTYNLTFQYHNFYDENNTLGLLHRLYNGSGDHKLLMAYTKLERTGARRIFPCWDEPRAKASFIFIIQHRLKYQVLSNMAEANRSYHETDLEIVTSYFPQTPPMSTYLISIVICDYSFITSENLLVRLYARHNALIKISSLLNIAEKVIGFMSNYTGISYESFGFRKLNILMIPHIGDWVADIGNWGLIILQEKEQYTDNNVLAFASDEEWVTLLIAHECARQWFGGLVTVHSWTDLWIIEGIVTYFQYFIVDQIKPSWRIMDKLVVSDEIHKAIERELKPETAATNITSKNMGDVMELDTERINSRIAYLIRMLTQIIGDKKIHHVWKKILKKHEYRTVTANNIIDEFAKAADMEIEMFREIFNNGLNTPGFPVLTVIRNYYMNKLSVRQERLLFSSDYSESSNQRYWIMIDSVVEDDMNFVDVDDIVWMHPNNKTLEFTGFPSDKWVIFNQQQFGYYSVNYDKRNWELIIGTLKSENFTKIHVRNRLQLVHDAFLLLRTNRITHKLVLTLMSYLEWETDIIPWIPVWEGIEFMENYLKHSKYLSLFKKYALHLMNKLFKNLGINDLPGDSHLLKYYRADILSAACLLGSISCQREASNKLIQWIARPAETQLLPKMKKIVLCYGVRDASDAAWDHLWNEWLKNPVHDLFSALSCTFNRQLLKKLLSSVFFNDKQYKQDNLSDAIKVVASSSYNGVYAAIDFLSENWQFINKSSGFNGPTIQNFISIISTEIDRTDHLDKNFIEQHRSDLIKIRIDLQKLKDEMIQNLKDFKKIIFDYETFFFSLAEHSENWAYVLRYKRASIIS